MWEFKLKLVLKNIVNIGTNQNLYRISYEDLYKNMQTFFEDNDWALNFWHIKGKLVNAWIKCILFSKK